MKVNFLILHDIEGLKVSDPRVLAHEWNAQMFNDVLMTSYLNSLRLQYGLDPRDKIYIFVDEAQRYFPSFLKDPDVILFFDKHRHKGVELYLITQHEKKLCFAITSVGAKEIRAVNTIVNPFGSFLYHHKINGEQYATSRLKRDPAVFAMYKSFDAGEGKQEKSKLRYFLVALPLLALVLAVLYFATLSDSLKSTANAQQISELYKPSLNSSLPVQHKSENLQNENKHVLIQQNITPPSSVNYMGPEIVSYINSTDSLRYKLPDSKFEYLITVDEFLTKYPSSVYGYGFIHVRNKLFRLTSADCATYIFPVGNPVYKRSYIKSEPVAVVKNEQKPMLPLEFLNKTEMPDRSGYRRSDYERLYMRQRGFDYDSEKLSPSSGNSSVDLTPDKP